MALQDVLATSVTGEGYFSTIFANAFFGNDATLQSLSTRTIYLRQGGYIQSDQSQYIPNQLGLNIDYAGNIDANGLTHLGGKVAIGISSTGNTDFDTYDVVIGGNTKIAGSVQIKGRLDGADGTLHDVNITGNSTFAGDIDSGPLLLSSETTPGQTVTYSNQWANLGPNNDSNFVTDVTGTYTINGTTYNFTSAAIYLSDYRYNSKYRYYELGFLLRLFRNGANVYSNTVYTQSERSIPNPLKYFFTGTFTYTYNTHGAKTFRLRNMPTTPPSEIGSVFIKTDSDGNGTLRIKL
jgi:hypothetical protein